MKILNYLIPNVLKKLDRHILQNYPIIWETKIHFVLFYSAIVANLMLFTIGWLYPISDIAYMPFERFASMMWGWGLLFAFLAIFFYAYQQSFIRIKIYTLKQNLLRYTLYMLAVCSILSNVLVLPHTLIYRVNQLTSEKKLKQDFFAYQKAAYLAELIEKVYMLKDLRNDKNTYLEQIKKTSLNKNHEVEIIIKEIEDFEQIINKKNITDWELKIEQLQKTLDEIDKINKEKNLSVVLADFYSNADYIRQLSPVLSKTLDLLIQEKKRIIKSIRNHPNWHPVLKQQMVSKIELSNVLRLDLSDFKECNFNLFAPSIKNFYTKYSLSDKFIDKNNEGFNSYSNHLLDYHRANFFLYTSNGSSTLNSLLTYRYKYLLYLKYQDPENIKTEDEFLERDVEYFENNISFFNGVNDFMIELLNEEKLDKAIQIQWNFRRPTPNYYPQASGILIIFTSLLLLTIKLFTLRNIFIAGFSMFASFFLLNVLINSNNLYVLNSLQDILDYQIDRASKFILGFPLLEVRHHLFFFPWLIPVLIVFFTLGLASFVSFKNIHFKWIQAMWTFVLSNAMVASTFTCLSLFSIKLDTYEAHQKFLRPASVSIIDAVLINQITYIYPILALLMFGMYILYNRISILPQRK